MASRLVDISGLRFGKLTAISFVPYEELPPNARSSPERRNGKWKCQCDCGKVCYYLGGNLRSGGHRSCGCEAYCRHGMAKRGGKTKEYNAFINARKRCENKKDAKYPDYGGRGIKFLFKDFVEFFECVGPAPTPKHTLDRVNNNGNYEKGNLRWATQKQQAANRRKRRFTKHIVCPHCLGHIYGSWQVGKSRPPSTDPRG